MLSSHTMGTCAMISICLMSPTKITMPFFLSLAIAFSTGFIPSYLSFKFFCFVLFCFISWTARAHSFFCCVLCFLCCFACVFVFFMETHTEKKNCDFPYFFFFNVVHANQKAEIKEKERTRDGKM